MTKENTESALEIAKLKKICNAIMGLPLSQINRAADMLMLGFGQIRPVKDGEVSDWSLHFLCSWRLLGPSGIITGHRDLWEPLDEEDWSEDWDYESGNLQDESILEFFNFSGEKYFVEDIAVKNCGDLEVLLSGGYKIETFLNHTFGDAWLIFEPGDLNSFFHMDQDLSKALFSAK